MNVRKIIGYIVALAVCTIPLKAGLLNVAESASPSREGSNLTGTLLFVLFLVGIFVSYWLIDSSNAQKKAQGGDAH